jgi:beta-N-acetylhexosaminidase
MKTLRISLFKNQKTNLILLSGVGIFLLLMVGVIQFFIIGGQKETLRKIRIAQHIALDNYVQTLPVDDKISQIFLVSVEGNRKYIPVEKTGALIGNPRVGEPLVPGGVLLFSFNIANSKEQVIEYIKSIKDYYYFHNKVPPYVSIDQEGGYVNRLRGITEMLPSAKLVASEYTLEEAAVLYANQARQMAELGFSLNLAPVAEIETKFNEDFLDTRSFGTLEQVTAYGSVQIQQFKAQKIGSAIKHFPGNTNLDPHTGLPEISVNKSELNSTYIEPFRKLMPYADAVLMSHARINVIDNPAADSQTPACLSDYWVKRIIRGELGFDGLVISDDIFMGALVKNGYDMETAAVSAINAGVDVIMISEKRFGDIAKVLLEHCEADPNFATKLDRACRHVIEYKIKNGLLRYELIGKNKFGPMYELVPFRPEER